MVRLAIEVDFESIWNPADEWEESVDRHERIIESGRKRCCLWVVVEIICRI
jgi:hypothetical protein